MIGKTLYSVNDICQPAKAFEVMQELQGKLMIPKLLTTNAFSQTGNLFDIWEKRLIFVLIKQLCFIFARCLLLMLDCIEISCASVGTVFSLEDFYLVAQKKLLRLMYFIYVLSTKLFHIYQIVKAYFIFDEYQSMYLYNWGNVSFSVKKCFYISENIH